jgi:hypothetical protein
MVMIAEPCGDEIVAKAVPAMRSGAFMKYPGWNNRRRIAA